MDITKQEVMEVLATVAASFEGLAGLVVRSTPLSPLITPADVENVRWTTEVSSRLLQSSAALRNLKARLLPSDNKRVVDYPVPVADRSSALPTEAPTAPPEPESTEQPAS